MDVAYDHIQEESFAEAEPAKAGENKDNRLSTDINSEFQEAYKAISSSPWAATLGGFLGSVKKQGEQYYAGARQEYANASEQATKGISSVIGRARGLSLNQPDVAESAKSAESSETITEHPDKPESLPADILKEAGGILSLFKTEATKRLKDFERAEDAADEALLKFGTNIRNFLRDAVTVAPPPEGAGEEGSSKVLFESKDSDGKRVIHTTRFDAQLHVIHSSLDSFLKDPVSPEWSKWAEKFDIDAKTDAIAKDLEQHEELRKAMEKLVPEKVEYAQFWKRYYFLRFVIESEEKRRREMLKASAEPTEEDVAWDDDDSEESEDDDEEEEDDDEEDSDDSDESESESSTPNPRLAASQGTLKPAASKVANKPAKSTTEAAPSRRSNDQNSQAGSDASYDLVSGATSRTPGSPRDAKKDTVAEESDEEDWE